MKKWIENAQINPVDQLHRIAYQRQWEFTVRLLAIGGFMGGLIAVIFRTDLLGAENAANFLGAIGAVFAALALTSASDAELQTRRDEYRREREEVEVQLLARVENTGNLRERELALKQIERFVARGRSRNWHNATLEARRELLAESINHYAALPNPAELNTVELNLAANES